MEGVGKAGTRRAVPALVVGAAALSMPGTGYRAQRSHAKGEGGAGGGLGAAGVLLLCWLLASVPLVMRRRPHANEVCINAPFKGSSQNSDNKAR